VVGSEIFLIKKAAQIFESLFYWIQIYRQIRSILLSGITLRIWLETKNKGIVDKAT
jgi:hypothetical protein